MREAKTARAVRQHRDLGPNQDRSLAVGDHISGRSSGGSVSSIEDAILRRVREHAAALLDECDKLRWGGGTLSMAMYEVALAAKERAGT